ncbi:large ribosomal subunit protein mL46-like [Liolophura sinensis]|uniref:large ribosomal subunit protein mL46-like n=1 Tax=Liolophura sinensis TaxID=3198878 RepID=UPI00315836AC
MAASFVLSTNARLLSKRLFINGRKALKNVTSSCSFSQASPSPAVPPPVVGSQGWQLWSAVCIERPAVITQPMTDLEKAYLSDLLQVEHEHSYLSEHEIRHKNDLLKAEQNRMQDDVGDADIDSVKQTALDQEDVWESEFQAFTPADRITDADRKNDMKSLRRKLDRKLFFIIKQKLGDTTNWVLPQGYCAQGESLRQAAERVLQTQVGPVAKAIFMGNVPCGFYKYKFPSALQTQTKSLGVKLFFFKAYWLNGEIQKGADVEDYLWLTKDELLQYLKSDYYKTIKDFIFEI